MSVIQKIRDKYARIAVIAIAVSLLGFIMMDAFAGRTGLFSNRQSNTIGKVNGTAIDRTAFEQKVKEQEEAATQQGYELNDDTRQQIATGLWDQEVTNLVMQDEYEKLGLTVTDKELQYALYGPNPPQFLAQAFTDSTGKYDGDAARRQVTSLLKSGTPQQKDYINKQFEFVKQQRLMMKYMSLLTNSVYFPKWLLEKRNVDNSLMGKMSYVMVPYSTIPDSTIKVSDDEIRDFMNEHKDAFELKEELRSIDYVMFNAAPSKDDSAAIRSDLEKRKGEFAAAANPGNFVTQQGSTIPYYDNYVAGSSIQVPSKDSILALSKGGVYGPYLDAGTYVIARMVDTKVMPDSAKVKHILIGTSSAQNPQGLSDSVAHHRIDSIKLAIDRGANFDTLAKRFSDDKASAVNGGLVQVQSQQGGPVSDYFTPGQMVPAFNDSVFNGRVGERKIVKSDYGYHLIWILDLKKIEPHYKIAYLAKPIYTSNETDQEAHNQANLFAGDSRDQKSFDENYNKTLRPKGMTKLTARNITPMSYRLEGQSAPSRSLIKKIFDADRGDVLSPERVGDNYIVAIVTGVDKPGLPSVATVRPSIEPMLRNRKKGEQIIKNIGNASSLDAVSAKMNQPVQTLDSVRFAGGSMLSYEPKVLGALFNPDNKGKAVAGPVAGMSGVFAIRVENVSTIPVPAASIEDQRRSMEMQVQQGLQQELQQGRNPITDVLKNAATVKDYRAKFF